MRMNYSVHGPEEFMSLHVFNTHPFSLIACQRLTERPAVHWAWVCLVCPRMWPCAPVQRRTCPSPVVGGTGWGGPYPRVCLCTSLPECSG